MHGVLVELLYWSSDASVCGAWKLMHHDKMSVMVTIQLIHMTKKNRHRDVFEGKHLTQQNTGIGSPGWNEHCHPSSLHDSLSKPHHWMYLYCWICKFDQTRLFGAVALDALHHL